MSQESYVTIQRNAEGLYKEKGSKFLSFAMKVSSEEEVKHQLGIYRKKYFDARHHCYAYITGPEPQRIRLNDDGEPHHSAGDPILGQIQSRNLMNVMVIVVRYFGGTKLGVGGLVTAYKTAASEALSRCGVMKVIVTKSLKMEYNYDQTNDILKLVDDLDIKIAKQDYSDNCRLLGSIPISNLERFKNRIELIPGVSFSIN